MDPRDHVAPHGKSLVPANRVQPPRGHAVERLDLAADQRMHRPGAIGEAALDEFPGLGRGSGEIVGPGPIDHLGFVPLSHLKGPIGERLALRRAARVECEAAGQQGVGPDVAARKLGGQAAAIADLDGRQKRPPLGLEGRALGIGHLEQQA